MMLCLLLTALILLVMPLFSLVINVPFSTINSKKGLRSRGVTFQATRISVTHASRKSSSTKIYVKVPLLSPASNDVTETNLLSFMEQFHQPFNFLLRASLIGLFTGLGVVVLKTLIFDAQGFFYETVADALPKPAFYWPIALYPILGASFVSLLSTFYGPGIWNGLDFIAKSIDSQEVNKAEIEIQNSISLDNSNNLFVDLNADTSSDPGNLMNSSYLPAGSAGRRYGVKSRINPKQFIFTKFLGDFGSVSSTNESSIRNDEVSGVSSNSSYSIYFRNYAFNSSTSSSSFGQMNATLATAISPPVPSSADTVVTVMVTTLVSDWMQSSKRYLNKISSNKLFVNASSSDLPALPMKPNPEIFDPLSLVMRLSGAVTTLGSGCSLGPEGPSVEIGGGFSRVFSEMDFSKPFKLTGNDSIDNHSTELSSAKSATSTSTSVREKHHLFLAGTAAGVAAGFGAPIAGVLFALECGNRCLARNTVKLEEDASDAPRADIAAIVLAATIANIMVQLFLQQKETLFIQGNSYAMVSPFFELPVYFGLAIISGLIAVIFDNLKIFFKKLFRMLGVKKTLRPLLAGTVCGVVAIFYPQTLFNGYATLGDLLSNHYLANAVSPISNVAFMQFLLLLQLLFIKLALSSLSLVSGLIGGVFAPSLFFGAVTGTAYHYVAYNLATQIKSFILIHSLDLDFVLRSFYAALHSFVDNVHSVLPTTVYESLNENIENFSVFIREDSLTDLLSFFTISNAQAYATVGAAATLGALFKAPLTSSMLMFELTQNHDIVIPVLFSSGLGGYFASIISRSQQPQQRVSATK